MIALYLACLVLVVGVLQFFLAKRQLRQLVCDHSYDHELVEPDEKMTLTARVRNIGKFPVFFAGLAHYITNELTVHESGKAPGQSFSRRLGENRISSRFFLMPHRMLEIKLHLSAPDRGKYLPGKYFLETGDYLGLRSATRSAELKKPIVVMPRRSEDLQAFDALSGYLGDLSVRRFLFEDPVLTIGTRDYTGHEPMKSIAWNQTARSGRMQVHVYDHTVEADATVILNFENGSPEQREECLRLTRTVCEKLEKDHVRYAFYTNGDIHTPHEDLSRLCAGLGKRHFDAIMYGCGQSNLHQSVPFATLVEDICRAQERNHGYILITPPLSPKAQTSLHILRRTSDRDICVLTAKCEKEVLGS